MKVLQCVVTKVLNSSGPVCLMHKNIPSLRSGGQCLGHGKPTASLQCPSRIALEHQQTRPSIGPSYKRVLLQTKTPPIIMHFLTAVLFVCLSQFTHSQQPYYVRQCRKSDPEVNACLTKSANYLVENFRRGIPELEINEVEPIIIDEISIALGNGPDGYRAMFRDIHAYGVSNLTVTGFRSDLDTLQFQMSLYIPRITAKAQYRSSGVLILVRASGGGDYWGEYEGVRAKVYIKAHPNYINGRTYLSLQQLKMDFSIKDIRMGVENVHNGNSVLQAALNLFINTNAQDLLKEMKPDLKKKLMTILTSFLERMLAQIPYESWITE